MPVHIPDWRRLNESQIQDYADSLSEDWYTKYTQGTREYGPVFQGDPLKHLTDEVLDILSYLKFVRAERAYLKAVLRDVQKEVLPSALKRKVEQANSHPYVDFERPNPQTNVKLAIENANVEGADPEYAQARLDYLYFCRQWSEEIRDPTKYETLEAYVQQILDTPHILEQYSESQFAKAYTVALHFVHYGDPTPHLNDGYAVDDEDSCDWCDQSYDDCMCEDADSGDCACDCIDPDTCPQSCLAKPECECECGHICKCADPDTCKHRSVAIAQALEMEANLPNDETPRDRMNRRMNERRPLPKLTEAPLNDADEDEDEVCQCENPITCNYLCKARRQNAFAQEWAYPDERTREQARNCADFLYSAFLIPSIQVRPVVDLLTRMLRPKYYIADKQLNHLTLVPPINTVTTVAVLKPGSVPHVKVIQTDTDTDTDTESVSVPMTRDLFKEFMVELVRLWHQDDLTQQILIGSSDGPVGQTECPKGERTEGEQ